jgi:hypothetical protein
MAKPPKAGAPKLPKPPKTGGPKLAKPPKKGAPKLPKVGEALPQAGELDSGSFILRQNNVPVCWMFSVKAGTSMTGYERWWWGDGFTIPGPGVPVVWQISPDVYTTSQSAQWIAARRPMATVFRYHEVDIDDPTNPNP